MNNVAPICNCYTIRQLRQRAHEHIKEYKKLIEQEIEGHGIIVNKNDSLSKEIAQSKKLQENA